ncbi:MAG TPA: NAD(P)/FAD-dependent oxidoreductase [Streptosporangiaceae bacterium]|jgi:phytoene dehydrogenase-like protein
MAERWDAVVVGAGHNGLVAAFYLARAGLRTLVLERRPIVGGACVTEEFAPGFRASPGAYVLSMLREPVWQDLRLRERGLRVAPGGPSLHLYPDGQTLTLHQDHARTLAEIKPLSAADADAFTRFEHDLESIATALMPLFDWTPPDPRLTRRRDLAPLLRFGRLAMRHRRQLPDAAFLFSTSARQFLDEYFRTDILKSALGWEAISNTLAGPSTPGTAYTLLHDAASGSGGGIGWGFVAGGMGSVTALMADAAREAGAEIRTGAEVSAITVSGGQATGVALAGGEQIQAARVVSNADPKRTFLTLLDGAELPDSFLASVRAYRCEGASMKINLAVAELPQVRGGEGRGLQPYHGGLIQFTKPLTDLDKDQDSASRGVPAARAHAEICIPTVHDPSLAPEGQHVVTIGVRSQPYRLSGPGWDAIREEVADRVVAYLGEFMPNLPGSVLHREILTPLDLERRLALTGGHHFHGDMAPDQLLFLRPVRGFADYRTPVGGLYLCGAGTHPGGGVTGANGRNCARELLRDARKRMA